MSLQGLDVLFKLEQGIGEWAKGLQALGDSTAEEVGQEMMTKMRSRDIPIGDGQRHNARRTAKETLRQSIFSYSKTKINDARVRAGLPKITTVGLNKNYFYSHLNSTFKAHTRIVNGKPYNVKARSGGRAWQVPGGEADSQMAATLLQQRLEIYAAQRGIPLK